MKYGVLLFAFCLYPSFASAQWAVYDDKVFKELQKVNKVSQLAGKPFVKLDGDFKGYKEMDGVKLQYLDVKFNELSELTDSDKQKYIGTEESCGDPLGNQTHYRACVGLRNLRIQTLKQSQAILTNLDKRRKQIVDLIEGSRGVSTEAGQLARYQFELQGLQALMQTDSMQLQVLMDGYRERAKLYEQQQMEARSSSTGNGSSEKGKSAKAPRFNVF